MTSGEIILLVGIGGAAVYLYVNKLQNDAAVAAAAAIPKPSSLDKVVGSLESGAKAVGKTALKIASSEYSNVKVLGAKAYMAGKTVVGGVESVGSTAVNAGKSVASGAKSIGSTIVHGIGSLF